MRERLTDTLVISGGETDVFVLAVLGAGDLGYRVVQLDTLSLQDVFLLKPVHMSALEAAIASRWADRID
jgi:hypothetical protein